MIKINLLPQRKPKRASEPGQRQVVVGAAALAVAAAVTFVAVHLPLSSDVSALEESNEDLSQDIAAKRRQLKDADNLKRVVAAAEERAVAIEALIKAKSVPAYLLQELSDILTPGRLPTMTKAMAMRISEGPQGDANRRFALDWDPKHVWITSFTETAGAFVLDGGAQSDPDVTQLAKRMQASVYFLEVTPRGGERLSDRDSNVSYYKFTITGRVVY
jgi:type IV pilus assembly protein PilN